MASSIVRGPGRRERPRQRRLSAATRMCRVCARTWCSGRQEATAALQKTTCNGSTPCSHHKVMKPGPHCQRLGLVAMSGLSLRNIGATTAYAFHGCLLDESLRLAAACDWPQHAAGIHSMIRIVGIKNQSYTAIAG